MLQIKNLTKRFGEKVAVDDLTLHIAPGEIYGFIGHNGAGKTTTLRSVAGIQQFDAGEIRLVFDRLAQTRLHPVYERFPARVADAQHRPDRGGAREQERRHHDEQHDLIHLSADRASFFLHGGLPESDCGWNDLLYHVFRPFSTTNPRK